MADAIESAMTSPSKWRELPFLLMVLYKRNYQMTWLLSEALASARSHNPWKDLFNLKKTDNAVYGDIFDAYVKKALSTFPKSPTTQASGQSNRNHDVGIIVNDVPVAIEASVLGASEHDIERWDALLEKKRRWKKSSVRGNVYSGNAYELIRRMTGKVLDKVAKGCDVNKCQLAADRPNLLFIGLPSLSAKPRDRDLSWALDALFSEAPWERTPRQGVDDVWSVLEERVGQANSAVPLTQGEMDSFMRDKLWPMFRRVSGIIVFDECRFVFGRVNYHAHPANRISHAEMGTVEAVMEKADWHPFIVNAPNG